MDEISKHVCINYNDVNVFMQIVKLMHMPFSSIICVQIVVAHGRVVTSSRQITEVKQRRARLVLGWVTGARVTLPAMCRDVGQAFHIMPPLSTQQWWVPGGTNNGEL